VCGKSSGIALICILSPTDLMREDREKQSSEWSHCGPRTGLGTQMVTDMAPFNLRTRVVSNTRNGVEETSIWWLKNLDTSRSIDSRPGKASLVIRTGSRRGPSGIWYEIIGEGALALMTHTERGPTGGPPSCPLRMCPGDKLPDSELGVVCATEGSTYFHPPAPPPGEIQERSGRAFRQSK